MTVKENVISINLPKKNNILPLPTMPELSTVQFVYPTTSSDSVILLGEKRE
jgi:hypothetical protein